MYVWIVSNILASDVFLFMLCSSVLVHAVVTDLSSQLTPWSTALKPVQVDL